MDDDGRQPMAKGHLGYSGNQKGDIRYCSLDCVHSPLCHSELANNSERTVWFSF